MKRRDTEPGKTGAAGGTVVEREALWRPDADARPCRIALAFDVARDPVRSAAPRRASGVWMLALVATVAGLASLPL